MERAAAVPIAIFACSLALLLAGCHEDERYFGTTTAQYSQRLVFDNQFEPATLDPVAFMITNEANVIEALFEGLTQSDPVTARPMAALATHYEISSDGLEYTFYLRGHPNPHGTRLPNSHDLSSEWNHGVRAPPDSIPAHWSDGTVVNANIRMLINRGRGYKNLRYLLLKAKRVAATNVGFSLSGGY